MKQKSISPYDQIKFNPLHGGYSDIRLWPCHMVLSSLVLFLAPQIGMTFAVIIVGVPAFALAKKVADKQDYTLASISNEAPLTRIKVLWNPTSASIVQ